jgi:hypothetical protein
MDVCIDSKIIAEEKIIESCERRVNALQLANKIRSLVQNSSCARQARIPDSSWCTFPTLDRDAASPSPILCSAKATQSLRPYNMPDKQIVSTLTAWLKEVTYQNEFIARILKFDIDCANSARQREDVGAYIGMRQLGYAGFFQQKSDFQGQGPFALR